MPKNLMSAVRFQNGMFSEMWQNCRDRQCMYTTETGRG